ncbi:MAG TPA: nitroreductase/quinone reductase family protein, partial [Rubrobacteraceae bacterium]|nr:nitroreductase/quinone reductase family protein [Rubrobacteraceae bacterium]
TMIARIASKEERAELWPRITSVFEGYARYQERTERPIPVVILEPAIARYPGGQSKLLSDLRQKQPEDVARGTEGDGKP